MKKKDFKEEYFEWMLRKINCRKFPVKKYYKLLLYLNEFNFKIVIKNDINRVSDAYEMRETFKESELWDAEEIPFDMRNGDNLWPASVLEVLVAMSCRIEDDVMADEEKGNRTSEWFWEMICNLGLNTAKESDWYDILNDFLSRRISCFEKPDDISTKAWNKKELWNQMNEVMSRKF